MSNFNEWRNAQRTQVNGYTERDAYEAGAASQQAKIDELQKRIDDLDKQLFVQKGLNRFLKGNQNDS